MQTSTSPLLNPDLAGKYIGISTKTIYSYCSARRIKHYRIGGRLRFKTEDLDLFLNQNCVEVANPKLGGGK